MLNDQIMASQVFADMYPSGGGGIQVLADAELDELTKDLAAARAARSAALEIGDKELAGEFDKKIRSIVKKILDKLRKYS